MDFTYTQAPANEPRFGLIVLQRDESLEHDLRRILPGAVNLLVSRVPSDLEVTPETLAQMEHDLPRTAALLPQAEPFAVAAYGCTSGTAVIGAERIATLIRDAAPVRQVTNPLSALLAACEAMGIKRLGVLSPYVAEVSDQLRGILGKAGVATPVFGSFNEAREENVVRISPGSIMTSAEALAAQGGIDAIFMSCTNLRTLEVIAPLEAATGLPVLSSNQVLGWHMMRLGGLTDPVAGYGRLLAEA
ncbi:Asp/Glu racemase [Aestuariicoccus sp. MJ-SS9]|uniref:maleate cis-trans isomerase family protein n=1 Tax=Aestuariicoccus sp. MJ-SS9 TaxID=3079855 RepID=UPI00290B7F5A|nr:Asp/Glu racemase [Aestuariicoccus sp. MJ-SS9]MDU8910405.1 Asp/Glu racemase [Aestuariicoccus sp. MJ-SS9]